MKVKLIINRMENGRKQFELMNEKTSEIIFKNFNKNIVVGHATLQHMEITNLKEFMKEDKKS